MILSLLRMDDELVEGGGGSDVTPLKRVPTSSLANKP
jgi:hypothetical protein